MGNITSSTLIFYNAKSHSRNLVEERVILPLLRKIDCKEKPSYNHKSINGDLHAFRILANASDLDLWETNYNYGFERENSVSLEKLAYGNYFVKGIANI